MREHYLLCNPLSLVLGLVFRETPTKPAADRRRGYCRCMLSRRLSAAGLVALNPNINKQRQQVNPHEATHL